MSPCSQTSLTESGLMVPLLSSALVSSIEHPGTVAVMCDGSGGASAPEERVCASQGYEGSMLRETSASGYCKAEALTICAH